MSVPLRVELKYTTAMGYFMAIRIFYFHLISFEDQKCLCVVLILRGIENDDEKKVYLSALIGRQNIF